MRTAIAWYAIVVGGLMAGWWAVDLRGGALQRPDRTPLEMRLHLAAELGTAGLLVIGGLLLVATGVGGLVLVALGMLLYTLIQSPGYFLARGERGPALMFGVLFVLTVLAIVGVAGGVGSTD